MSASQNASHRTRIIKLPIDFTAQNRPAFRNRRVLDLNRYGLDPLLDPAPDESHRNGPQPIVFGMAARGSERPEVEVLVAE